MGNDDLDVTASAHGASLAAAGLGRFGHHPDAATDFCVEVDDIAAEIVNLQVFEAGPAAWAEIGDRIERAMDFRVGGNPDAVAAKDKLREIGKQFSPPSLAAAGKRREVEIVVTYWCSHCGKTSVAERDDSGSIVCPIEGCPSHG